MSTTRTPDRSNQSEAELAAQWNSELTIEARKTKVFRSRCAIGMFLIAGTLALAGIYAWALLVALCGIVAFVMYLDANGHEHEIRERAKEKLFPGFNRVFGTGIPRREPAKRQSESAESQYP